MGIEVAPGFESKEKEAPADTQIAAAFEAKRHLFPHSPLDIPARFVINDLGLNKTHQPKDIIAAWKKKMRFVQQSLGHQNRIKSYEKDN